MNANHLLNDGGRQSPCKAYDYSLRRELHLVDISEQLDQRVVEAYASLFLAPKRDDGSQVASIVTIGAFEVLLVEMSSGTSELMLVWVELYSRHHRMSIDSRGCSELEEAIWVAKYFVSLATNLQYENWALKLNNRTSTPIAANNHARLQRIH